mgnify:FL=1
MRPWQQRLHEIIFEADTPAGKAFDVVLLLLIVISVVAVMLESVGEYRQRWGSILRVIEWVITILFSVEYLARLVCVRRPLHYATSFFGIVDVLSVIPTYLAILFEGPQYLLVIRTLRLVRVFRIFKLHQYVSEANALAYALKATRTKVSVFLLIVMTIVLILGSAMYLIEGEENGFSSIPKSVYWAVVTMTTVGYGDISPQTPVGQTIAALAMILGYSIIIVPTGIFSVEIIMAQKHEVSTQSCPACTREGHDVDAVFCKYCGTRL